MALKWNAVKDPDEVLDFRIDWLGTAAKPGPLLADEDTITASVWTLPAGITKDPIRGDFFDTTTATIWLTGGTDGETYLLQNRITTAAGRVFDQTVKLKVKTK